MVVDDVACVGGARKSALLALQARCCDGWLVLWRCSSVALDGSALTLLQAGCCSWLLVLWSTCVMLVWLVAGAVACVGGAGEIRPAQRCCAVGCWSCGVVCLCPREVRPARAAEPLLWWVGAAARVRRLLLWLVVGAMVRVLVSVPLFFCRWVVAQLYVCGAITRSLVLLGLGWWIAAQRWRHSGNAVSRSCWALFGSVGERSHRGWAFFIMFEQAEPKLATRLRTDGWGYVYIDSNEHGRIVHVWCRAGIEYGRMIHAW